MEDSPLSITASVAGILTFVAAILAFVYVCYNSCTFVSKATTASFVPELQYEARVYECLRLLQGVRVPVFLGAINLREVGWTYYYDIQVHIVYLMLLLRGGNSLDEVGVLEKARVK